jgi:hypothetical protein
MARTPIRFSHIYDALLDKRAKEFAGQPWFKDAIPLKRLLVSHRVLDPKAANVEVANLFGSTVVRGDWRSRLSRSADTGQTQNLSANITRELSRLGLVAASPLDRTAVPFNNSSLSPDRSRYYDLPEVQQKRLDALIAKRTGELEHRIVGDVPSVKPRLGNYKRDSAATANTFLEKLPIDKSGTNTLYLDETLEGAWRWQAKGRPVWLIQLWNTEGNGGIGQGRIFLLEGSATGVPKTKGSVVDLSDPLEPFWSGQYGATEHESRLKPELYLDRYIVMASVAAQTIAVYDLETNKVMRIFSDIPQADLLSSAILSIDTRHLIQVNNDGQYFVHEIASGQIVLSGRMVDDEIISYTPAGYYWSSYEGAHFVQFQFPGLPGVYPFQQFASVLNRPDYIRAALKEGATGEPLAPKLSPPPWLDISLAPTNTAQLRVHATARGTLPLKRLSFYADGQRIYDRDVTGTVLEQDLSVPNAIEARWLTAQVIDSNGLVSAPQSIRRPPTAHPTRQLHAVLVGNDIYANTKLVLKYARRDAERLGDAIKALPTTFYTKSTVSELIDSAATREAIRNAIQRVVETAKAEDTIVVSFAGHGLQDDQGAYYLTPYGFDETRIAETALAWREVAGLLHAAKARVIVILDACHAGLSGSEGLGTNDDAIAELIAGEHPPMLVLAASKGRQLSYEGRQWGGGVFTYALIEALVKKRADYDLDRDGAIEVSELYRAVRTILSRETQGNQSPWLVREDLLGDFVVF